jgi:hypothetical protein
MGSPASSGSRPGRPCRARTLAGHPHLHPGVLTTLLWSFSRNLAARFTGVGELREPGAATWALTLLLGASITSMVTGRAVGAHPPLVVGTRGIMVVVAMNVLTLRRLRTRARNDRFQLGAEGGSSTAGAGIWNLRDLRVMSCCPDISAGAARFRHIPKKRL